MLNTRKNARRILWYPSAVGARRSEAQQDWLGTLHGVPVALPLAFGIVENVRARSWQCSK